MLQNVNQNVNAFKVCRISLEEDEVILPELLGVYWRPSETSTGHLGLPFVEGGELCVVLVKVLEESLKDFLDLIINPRSVPQFDYQVECIDHREVFEANFVSFQILNKKRTFVRKLLRILTSKMRQTMRTIFSLLEKSRILAMCSITFSLKSWNKGSANLW